MTAVPEGVGANEPSCGESRAPRPRRRRTVCLVLLVLAVLGGALLGARVTENWPFEPRRYCWGAWQEGSGPDALGDDYRRVSKRESAPPERGRQATCVLALVDPGSDSTDAADMPADGGKTPPLEYKRVVAHVGPPPRAAGERRSAWLAAFLHGSAAPLPEGLPGVVGRDRGMFVLPRECDSGGLPTVATVRPAGEDDELGSEPEVAGLLMSLVRTAREKAGCAQGKPSRITAPVRASGPEGQSGMGREEGDAGLCRIPGMRFAAVPEGRYGAHVGAVDGRLQTCSVEGRTDKHGDLVSSGQFVMTSRPRLAALFAGMRGRDGLVEGECGGRRTVFFLQLDDRLEKKATPDSRRVFARTVDSVAERLDCQNVRPRA
ncbi:hypothetical protein [Streptomyces iconiensis]|uniref:Uncharacterized protein n=1 Tax=Streptomyces iconiensis TaxID=1384038 RepID=A0ABT6ZWE2_9ACTN|nr:hypothetical protein [Streptomyces iconiensis]MDJ1133399.1 hypothetical protein [Streptomyces iconiensis]